MAAIKCKMCGGDLDITEGLTVCECEYCGSKQTLPLIDSDRKANLYDRANHFRRNNEFDKAEGIYDQVLNEDPSDAEAYWSLVLCRYGIEYVEDPATHRRIPTVNRAQYTSIFADENYKKALEYSDTLQRGVYEAEAKAIDEIQKGILAISSKEEPFDVFICYKETDASGRRTQDSVIANELYHELTKEGFKVFFARITLEDKLGSAYEPYIFAALHSARVMVALGTKPEHFNAVWVKNEWSRYLALIRGGEKKTLIPAYRDMDPYDLPEEFSHLQAQDMSKLGFMPDLIRGIGKVLDAEKQVPATAQPQIVKQVVQQSTGGANLTAQLKRGQQALEDRDWAKADEFFDKALDMDAECAEAFLGLAMAENEVSSRVELAEEYLNTDSEINENKNLIRAHKFANDELRAWLDGLDVERAERKHREAEKRTQQQRKEAAERAEQERKEAAEAEYQRLMKEAKDKARREKNKKIGIIAVAATVVISVAVLVMTKAVIPAYKYKEAEMLLAAGDYDGAETTFTALGDFKDSAERIMETRYEKAEELLATGEKAKAAVSFGSVGDYKDAKLHTAALWNEIAERDSIAAGNSYTIGLKADGTVTAVGYNKNGECDVGGWTDIAAVVAGSYHTIGLKADGTVVAVGNNSGGRCDVGGWTDIVAIAVSAVHTVGLKSDGTVVAVGNIDGGRCDVGNWTDIMAIAAGDDYTVGLKADGTVVAVGGNKGGQCDVDGWTDVVAIAAGNEHTVGLKADDTVVAVGNNNGGRCDVSDWTDIVAIAAGYYHTVGLKADGTVIAVGSNSHGQCDVGGWTDVVAIAAGDYHTVGLKLDGTVVAVGDNNDDRCNVGDWKNIKIP